MKELLNKELKLVLHPTNILFIPLAFMLFIPNYPYLVIMFYTCLGVFFMCQFGRENNDVFFTMMLPVEKHKTVLARIISVSLLELLEIAVCVPIALLRAKIMTLVNAADLDVNITLFAFFFMIFGVFNIIFFPAYYKNVKRIGIEIVLCHALPLFKNKLDTPDPQFLAAKLVTLALGVVIWLALTFAAYKRSAALFEKQDI